MAMVDSELAILIAQMIALKVLLAPSPCGCKSRCEVVTVSKVNR